MKRLMSWMLVGAVALSAAGCALPEQPQNSPTPTGGGDMPQETVTTHVASLKGATTMGIVAMIDNPQAYLKGPATFDVEGTADAITPKLVSGDIDIALVPANLAAVLYAKTNGGIQVTAINTLNVLYVVAKGVDVTSLQDLDGRTVYSTGKGTTPQAVIDTVLAGNGLTDSVQIQYLSEATEVAAKMAAADEGIAILPQPYVTVLTGKDPSISVAIDLGEQFQAITGSPVVTGVTVVRSQFASAHPDQVSDFVAASAKSAAYTNSSPAAAGALIAAQGIAPNAAVAEAAIPECNIVSITGAEAQAALSGYLMTLFDANPAMVGGSLPDEGFYWA